MLWTHVYGEGAWLGGLWGRGQSSAVPPPQLPILASSVVSLYFLELTDIFQPVHSGYSCSDRSLSLPYILPRQEVCPLPLLFSLAFAAPTATVSPPPHTHTLGLPRLSLDLAALFVHRS